MDACPVYSRLARRGKVRLAQIIGSQIIVRRVEVRSALQGFPVASNGVVMPPMLVRLKRFAKLLNCSLWETMLILARIYHVRIAPAQALRKHLWGRTCPRFQTNLNHSGRRYQGIYVSHFIHGIESLILYENVITISFKIIEAESALIIRIHTGHSEATDLQFDQNWMRREVAFCNPHLPDYPSECLLSKRGRNVE